MSFFPRFPKSCFAEKAYVSQYPLKCVCQKCSLWFSVFSPMLKTPCAFCLKKQKNHKNKRAKEAKHTAYIRKTLLRGDILTETTPLAWATGQNKTQVRQRVHLIKSALYAGQTFYAFMLM